MHSSSPIFSVATTGLSKRWTFPLNTTNGHKRSSQVHIQRSNNIDTYPTWVRQCSATSVVRRYTGQLQVHDWNGETPIRGYPFHQSAQVCLLHHLSPINTWTPRIQKKKRMTFQFYSGSFIELLPKKSCYNLYTQRIHVWCIYLHLAGFYGKCWQIYHTWILWDTTWVVF